MVTVMRPLRRERLLEAFTQGRELLGQPFGKTTRYGIVDLDRGSPYHTPFHLNTLLDTLSRVGLRAVPVQSSPSGGWWVFVPLKDLTPSLKLGDMLEACARKAGLTLGRGLCEVYPHRSVPHQSVRLPGQAGFGPLDPQGVPVWAAEGREGLDYVLGLLERTSNRLDMRRKPRVPLQKEHHPLLAGVYTQRVREGEHYFKVGLQPGITRHEATLCVQAYLYTHLGGEEGQAEQLQALNDWIARGHNGLSEDWLKRPKHVLKEHVRMVRWQGRRVPKPKAPPKAYAEAARAKSEAALHALCMAALLLDHAGLKPTYARLHALTGTSPNTLSKYKSAWSKASRHPDKERILSMVPELPTSEADVLGALRPLILHSEPGIVDWVGNVSDDGAVTDVVPLLLTEDRVTLGDIFLRDLARDMRKAKDQPELFTAAPVPDDTAPPPGSPTEKNVEVLRARMVTKVLVGHALTRKHREQLLTYLVRTLKVNYPLLATQIEQKKLKVTFRGIPILKPEHFGEDLKFQSVPELGRFLGGTYLKMAQTLLKHRPDQAGLNRFAA